MLELRLIRLVSGLWARAAGYRLAVVEDEERLDRIRYRYHELDSSLLMPREYLRGATCVVLQGRDGELGGHICVAYERERLRCLQLLRRDPELPAATRGRPLREVNGAFFERRASILARLWLYSHVFLLATSDRAVALACYDNSKAGIQRAIDPLMRILHRGPTVQIEGMTAPRDETIGYFTVGTIRRALPRYLGRYFLRSALKQLGLRPSGRDEKVDVPGTVRKAG